MAEVQLHSLMCFGPYYDVRQAMIRQPHVVCVCLCAYARARTFTHRQTIAWAMMDVQMQSHSKYEIDNFFCSSPDWIMREHYWNFTCSTPGMKRDNYHLFDNFQTAGRKTKRKLDTVHL